MLVKLEQKGKAELVGNGKLQTIALTKFVKVHAVADKVLDSIAKLVCRSLADQKLDIYRYAYTLINTCIYVFNYANYLSVT